MHKRLVIIQCLNVKAGGTYPVVTTELHKDFVLNISFGLKLLVFNEGRVSSSLHNLRCQFDLQVTVHHYKFL